MEYFLHQIFSDDIALEKNTCSWLTVISAIWCVPVVKCSSGGKKNIYMFIGNEKKIAA